MLGINGTLLRFKLNQNRDFKFWPGGWLFSIVDPWNGLVEPTWQRQQRCALLGLAELCYRRPRF